MYAGRSGFSPWPAAVVSLHPNLASRRVDLTGDLLAMVWFDRLGILRSAVDRGIVQNKHTLEGVFV